MKSRKYFLINSLEGGGAERVVTHLAKQEMQQGYEVYIITLKDVIFYDLPKGIKHISLSSIRNNFCMFVLIPWYVYKFKKVQKKHHLSDGISFLEIANFVHILAVKNATISFRTHINFFRGLVGCIYKILIKHLYPKAAKIVVNSLENQQDLAQYLNISADMVEVIYNPIDTENIALQAKEKVEQNILEKVQGKKVFITTGRLILSKHHEKIIHALHNIGFKHDWIYLIVGDGPQRKYLEELTQKYGLDKNILFLGTQKNVFKYLHLADYFLYSSEVEGFPNVLAEAREMGIPIITTDFKSGAREILIGEYITGSINYPYSARYGTIIDPQDIVKQLHDILVSLLRQT